MIYESHGERRKIPKLRQEADKNFIHFSSFAEIATLQFKRNNYPLGNTEALIFIFRMPQQNKFKQNSSKMPAKRRLQY
jgi:hypothetical protein